MVPDNAPCTDRPCPDFFSGVVIAQLTLPTDGETLTMKFDAQGNSRRKNEYDWEEHCIHVLVGGPNSGGRPEFKITEGPAIIDMAEQQEDGTDCLTSTAQINAACQISPAHQEVPDKCSAQCALIYAPWWNRCGGSPELQAADLAQGGALSTLASKCEGVESAKAGSGH